MWGVVPVEAGVGELEPVGEGATDGYRGLGLVGNAVVAVLQAEAVPVDGGLDVAVVGHVDDDLRPLVHMETGAGDGTVVGEHAQDVVADAVGHRRDAKVESVAVTESDGFRAGSRAEVGGVGREQVGHRVASEVSRPSRRARRSSGIGMGRNGLTSAPPVLPTG